MKPAREPASSRPKPCASLKNAPRILPVRGFLLTLIGRKHTVVRDQLSLRNLSVRAFDSRAQGFSTPPGSSTIELPSALAESGAYPPDRALPGSPRQCPLPLACHPLPKDTELDLGRGAHVGNTILNQSYRRRVSTDLLNREGH